MKHVLFTTTALVALSGAAIADVSISGNANVFYNTYEESGDFDAVSRFQTDIEIDASLTGGDAYSASVSVELTDGAANSDNSGSNPTIGDITVSGPFFSMEVGEINERIFKKVDGMSHIGGDDTGDLGEGNHYAIGLSAGDWTITVGDNAEANGARQNFGVAGSVGGWNVQAQSLTVEDEDGDSGFSAQGDMGGASIALAYETVGGAEKTGASVSLPISSMTAKLSVADTGASDTFWGASVSTSLGGASVSLGTDSNDQIDASVSTSVGDVSVAFGYEGNTKDDEALGNGMTAKLSYDLGGGSTAYLTYNEDVNGDDDDAYSHGTRAGISFSF